MAFWTKDTDLSDLPLQLAEVGTSLEQSVERFERDMANVAVRRRKKGQRITPPPPRRPPLGVRRPHGHPFRLRPLKGAPPTILQQRRLRGGTSPVLLGINAARVAGAVRSGVLLGLRGALDRARRRVGGIV